MKPTPRKLITIGALLMFSVTQIGVQISLAEPNSRSAAPPELPQQVVGRLTTRNNKPVLVNGVSARNGTSITTGATIETRADESATVDLGHLGRLDISPNTKVVLTFDQTGEMRALVLFGCVVLTAKKNTKGELATEKGTIASTNKETGGVLEMCFPPGAAEPTVGQGVATGAGASTGAPAAGGGVLAGERAATILAVVVIGGMVLPPILISETQQNQTNPSP